MIRIVPTDCVVEVDPTLDYSCSVVISCHCPMTIGTIFVREDKPDIDKSILLRGSCIVSILDEKDSLITLNTRITASKQCTLRLNILIDTDQVVEPAVEIVNFYVNSSI